MKKFLTITTLIAALSNATAYADDEKPTTRPDGIRMLLQVQDDKTGVNAPMAEVQQALRWNLAAQGKTEKAAWLGVATSRPPLALLKQLKIKYGLVVDEVIPGSPAELAGLKPQDVIEKVDDQIIINPAQLEGVIRLHNPGNSIALTLLHEGDRTTVTAKLVEHDVLVMQDFDPQVVSDIFATGARPGSPGGYADAGGLSKLFMTPAPGMHSNMQIMTDVSASSSDGTGNLSKFESQFSDGKKQLTMVRKGKQHILTVKDMDGKSLFEGPIDTDEMQKGIPADLLPAFRQMQKMENLTDDIAKP